MSQAEEPRNVLPWSRTFRNSDNPTGPDFRPQFVQPNMPFADDFDGEPPHGGLTVEEVTDEESGGGEDPKGSTVMASVVSLPPTENSPKVASPQTIAVTTVDAASGEAGQEVPEA